MASIERNETLKAELTAILNRSIVAESKNKTDEYSHGVPRNSSGTYSQPASAGDCAALGFYEHNILSSSSMSFSASMVAR
jgi:hypothetical protein